MSNKKVKDAHGNDVEITKASFTLSHDNKPILDRKFDRKPTTFTKDAFRRFCKNRSSLAAFFILAFLILSAFLIPLISNKNVTDGVRTDERFLPPKLFNTGFGFWDGTVRVNNIIINPVTGLPDERTHNQEGILMDTYVVSEIGDYFVDNVIPFGFGGFYIFGANQVENPVTADSTTLRNLHAFDFSRSDNLIIRAQFANLGVHNGRQFAEHRFILDHSLGRIELSGWSNAHGAFEINVNDFLFASDMTPITDVMDARLGIELRRTNFNTYIAIEELIFSSDNPDLAETLEVNSMTDASAKLRKGAIVGGSSFPAGHWETANAIIGVHRANILRASFTYNPYASVFNVQRDTTRIVNSRMQRYIDLGWAEFDFSASEADAPATFRRLDDRCSILSVNSVRIIATAPMPGVPSELIHTFDVQLIMYRFYGYNSVPRFIFGTNHQGLDMMTLVAVGLRTSLIIAFSVFAICFVFGIIWGSVSGYFGGKVDLLMERIMDILGAVPQLLILSLVFLHFGRNFGTFVFALVITGWLGVAARTRVQFYIYRDREFVLASRTLGASDKRLIFRHILPNAMGTIITTSVLMVAGVIGAEAALAFIGVGLTNGHSFGVILNQNQQFIDTLPHLVILPVVIFALFMISLNLFGNGLRDAVNSSLKGAE
ncbi:MAG: ABC transporter permease [Erysipelotrichales bacterium]|nr:ABC transporter permease [Erysipelotrichales bacterium]